MGEVCSRVQGNDGRMDLPILTISAANGWMKQEDRFSGNIAGREQKNYTLLQKGELSYNHGNSKLAKYGTVFSLQSYEEALVPRVYHSFKVEMGNADFLEYYFATKLPDKELGRLISSGARMDGLLNIGYDEFMGIRMMFPSTKEQDRIADYLRNLDHLITLHQRKHLGWLKVGKNAWEQRKAIDIADYLKGNGYSKGDLTDAGTPIILYGRLYTKYQFAISEVDTFAVPRNGAVYSQGNEVIVPASGETAEDIARASAVEKSGVLLGGDLNILRPFDFINPLFLALAISNGEPQKELAKKAQGKSVVHIHNTDIQEVTIAYPSRTEQDRIVSVFCNLDHLITLHQQK